MCAHPFDIWPRHNDSISTKRFCVARFIVWYAILLSVFRQSMDPIRYAVVILCVLYIISSASAPDMDYRTEPVPTHIWVDNEYVVNYSDHTNPSELSSVGTWSAVVAPPDGIEHSSTVPSAESSSQPCREVTMENPYGNPPVESLNEVPTCLDQFAKSDQMYLQGLPANEMDIFRTSHSMRQFYTMPVTTDINRQTDFALWCYDSTVDRTHANPYLGE
jgi:hypothetical protein